MRRYRDHVDVELLAGRLVHDFAVVDGVVRWRREQVIRRRRSLRDPAQIDHLGRLRVRHREGSCGSSATPLGAADDEEERHQAAERADVPDYRPRVQRVLRVALDYNKVGTCERAVRINNNNRELHG